MAISGDGKFVKKRQPSWGRTDDAAAERPPVDPFQKALGLLVRREHSQREIKRKLADCGAEADKSEEALNRLTELGFQDDGRFARSLARTRAVSGCGPQRIRAELGTHGMTAEQIETALDACETDWPSAACNLIARRFSGTSLADPKLRRKAIEFLLRRGFDHASAYAAVGSRGEASDEDAVEEGSAEPD